MACMAVTVVRYSDRPELWQEITELSDEVWPEYNVHGEIVSRYWPLLYERFAIISSCCMTTNSTPSSPKARPFHARGTAPSPASAPASTTR